MSNFLNFAQPVGTFNLQRYQLEMTRVTDLLDDPLDTRAAAHSLIAELEADWLEVIEDPVTVIGAYAVSAEETEREEIDYMFEVLMSPEDVARLDREESPFTITALGDEE